MARGGVRAGAGPKRIPTALRIVTANTRKDRMPVDEPAPRLPSRKPEPPSTMDGEARKEWRRVVDDAYECGLITIMDRTTLASYCQAYSVWVSISKEWNKLLKSGRPIATITTATGLKRNPLVVQLLDSSSRMVRYAAELGMTPSARSRVQAAPLPEKQAKGKNYFDGPDDDEAS